MTTQQLPDLRPVLMRGFDVADSLVSALTPADLDLATPCDEFAVRDLVDHLVLVVRRVRIVLEGRPFTDAVVSGATSLRELRAAWATALAELRDAAPGFDLTRLVTAPFGTVPAPMALGMYCGEVTVHSWDLAVAVGRTDLLDPSLAEALVDGARRGIPEDREGIPFGPVVPVADDAAAYDRLLGWYGRDPKWSR